MESKTFVVPNIGCDGCVKSIKNAVSDLEGVTFVSGNKDTKQITLKWDAPANWNQIVETLKEIEYPPAEAVNS